MVDTIILRIHNLSKYDTLIKRLELKKRGGYTSEIAEVETAELQRLRGAGYNTSKQIIDILKINRTGQFLVKTQVGKQMNASNHYAFTYFINWTRGYIEFNFSIPKYKFGSNVLQFVPHYVDKEFIWAFNSEMPHNLKILPKMIRLFIIGFLKKEFPLEEIDLKNVEVNRIDVCFNQMFRTKEDALKFLEYQKRLKKKYAKDEEGVMREYATSLMYVTKKYSAKIYHKGSEYKVNDSKEHEKINKEKKHEYFKVEKFQAFADRILRYELTIRNGYLNYLYKHKIFRKDCRLFRIDYKNYQRVLNAMQKNDRIAKKVGTLKLEEKEKFLKVNPYEKISPNDRKTYKYVSNLIETKTNFMMQITDDAKIYNEKTIASYKTNTAKFSTDLILLCLNKLLSFIKEFQIKELPEEELIINKIDQVNSIGRSPLPKAEMLRFYALLKQHGSFKEAAKFSGMSRATIFRYKARFKEIGISESTIKPIENYSMPQSKIDFKEYHSALTYDICLLRGIRILN